ncbi:hypothetical protein Bresa_02168|uniref:Uncharacterized protein n=1 Tax=Brenneria salicis ATCC 15712 = DSM 30166 TaxID=714314 RepID=A0A366I4A7_9GAMM|nr:hypothetical protein [Brenneria salicis ATCC 15712 = DSM 30166]RBP62844.1 hypothetical protein DES54_11423 [Brenneria salicis ATCC 15712 = DSM 30166]
MVFKPANTPPGNVKDEGYITFQQRMRSLIGKNLQHAGFHLFHQQNVQQAVKKPGNIP